MYPQIDRVKLVNYRSIAKCNVLLSPLTVLVGPNGSGKSNFVDALRFLRDALRNTLDQAVRDRGGINQVRRVSIGHPNNFSISVEIQLDETHRALYAVTVGAQPRAKFQVLREKCKIVGFLEQSSQFIVEKGKLVSGGRDLPQEIEPDRLFLAVASSFSAFRPVYDALSQSGFYNLNPDRLRSIQDPDPGEILERDGRNIASVLRRMEEEEAPALERVFDYLRRAVPGIDRVRSTALGPKETLDFFQSVVGSNGKWRFPASGMSDGTLRFFGILIAIFQGSGIHAPHAKIPLIGIEEPEVAIHPGAALKLMDAILEATHSTQILITTHSPELLEHDLLQADQILAVDSQSGETTIAGIDEASKSMIQERLMTAGELLRQAQIEPSREQFRRATQQLVLFDFIREPAQ